MMRPKRVEPKPGQESVWDYPRPPRIEDFNKHIKVIFNNLLIADTSRAKRILETSGPPVYYIPPTDIKMAHLIATRKNTFCEWKGIASYYTVVVSDKRAENAAWFYTKPTSGYESIKDYVAFYPQKMDACYLDGELVKPQSGSFYGGWIISEIVGPFKGEPGTEGW
jgi:uncharacterized protein (DUF427 family)